MKKCFGDGFKHYESDEESLQAVLQKVINLIFRSQIVKDIDIVNYKII